MGRKGTLPDLVLSDYERIRLSEIARRRKSAQGLAKRARIILECAEGLSNLQVAKKLGVSNQTVGAWRTRFIENRLEGLDDLPRSGAPRKVGDEKVEEIVSKTLESAPVNATHWSVRKMADCAGVSRDTVSRIWKAFGLQPHRTETFRLSTDPFFIEKVRDVVGLYMSPPENALVLCVDEKSQIQALERSQPVLPMQTGFPERRSHDYYRHGTTSLFAALDVKTGQVYGQCQPSHTHKEFLTFLRKIEREVPSELEIHAVLDNYATHKTPAVERWLVKHPRWHLHFIPTHSSWLNQVERWFAKITNDMIRRGVFLSVRQLEKAIENYIEANNQNPKPFQWTANADVILGKVARICEKLL
ncbi:MAG: IS630 family transposase [Verrucomicrobiales bacterium]